MPRQFNCKIFSNEVLFASSQIARRRSELSSAATMPLSAVILLNSPTVGPWEQKEYTRLHTAYRPRKGEAASDQLPCYFICADGAYSTLKKGWAAGEASWQEQMPDVVMGDMDSCDSDFLPPGMAKTDGPVPKDAPVQLYATVGDIPLEVLTAIRQRSLTSTEENQCVTPIFIRIECQMTTDFQKVVHLIHRLEEVFPSDFPRFSRVVSEKAAAPFQLETNPHVHANGFLQKYESVCDHLLQTLPDRPTGAWADSLPPDVQNEERQRIAALLLEASGKAPRVDQTIRQYLLPNICTLGALGGRFDHEMAAMCCVLEHSSIFHIMLTNPYAVVVSCWTDGLTQWIPFNEADVPASSTADGRAAERLCECAAGCGVIPMGTVREMETTGLLYNVVKGRPGTCDAVTQTSAYRFAFDGLVSACNTLTERLVTVDLRRLQGSFRPDSEEGETYNPPTLLSCARC